MLHDRAYDIVAQNMTDSKIGAQKKEECEKSYVCFKCNNE